MEIGMRTGINTVKMGIVCSEIILTSVLNSLSSKLSINPLLLSKMGSYLYNVSNEIINGLLPSIGTILYFHPNTDSKYTLGANTLYLGLVIEPNRNHSIHLIKMSKLLAQ